MVFTSSANAVVPKSGSEAYDVSKAAVNHLIRELAIGLGPLVRVNGIAPATVIAGSAMFPRDRVIVALQKYDIAFDDGEPTEESADEAGGVLREAHDHAPADSAARTAPTRSAGSPATPAPRRPGTSFRSTADCRKRSFGKGRLRRTHTCFHRR